MADQEKPGVELPPSSLSHKDLRMLCLDNDLSISGKKSVLVERLLDAGVSWEDLGLDLESEEEHLEQEELILEESEPMDVEEPIEELVAEIEESEPMDVEEPIEEDEIFEAEIIEEIKPASTTKITKEDSQKDFFKTLLTPKALLSFIIVGLLIGSLFWYVYSQPEPFTADKLRYGDSMTFSISNGNLLIEGEELVEQIAHQLNAEDKMCGKIEVDYVGTGSVTVTEGGSIEIANQPDDSKLGAVQKKGSFGETWLTLEQRYEYNFDDVDIATNTPIANKCSSTTLGNLNDNQAQISVDSWTEIRNQELLRSDIGYEFQGGDLGSIRGKTVTYGLDNFGEVLQNLIPGIALAFAPIELDKLLEGAFLSEGVSGEKWNWNWTVAGTDEVGGKETWKIYLENTEVSERCFGSAKINLWASKDSPWPVKQYVDLKISNFDEDRTSCSKSLLEQVGTTLFDIEIPQGRFNLEMMLMETSFTSGGDLVDWKETYSNRPAPGQGHLTPTHNWKNNNEIHMPDNSELREYTIEETIKCVNETIPNSDLITKLDAGAYIWRAIDDRSNSAMTYWNLSWVDPADQSGWALIEIRDTIEGEDYCEIDGSGIYESQSIAHNSDSISITNSLTELETRILDSNKFPELSGTNGIIATNGELSSETQIGYLVLTPNDDLNEILDLINRDDGAVSFDLQRNYEQDGWDVSVELLVDATNGRIIGWTQSSTQNIE
tara:strand:- start:86 stop:2245 length:2160 start_codon:yes stop_codon:yes gene_type:complete